MTLRIQISEKAETVALTLSGRMQAEEVPGLQRLFEVEGQGRCIVPDLREVKLVDRETVKFPGCCEENGIRLDSCPAYIRELIVRDQAGSACRNPLRRIPW